MEEINQEPAFVDEERAMYVCTCRLATLKNFGRSTNYHGTLLVLLISAV
jgi:hypothetical protein